MPRPGCRRTPPFRCAYVARQASVKKSYRVWMTAAERTAMLRVLARCPQQPLLSRAAATRAKARTAATRPPTTPVPAPTARPTRPAPTTQPVPSPPSPSPPAPVYYQNCAAVRAAGKAPLYRNDPGYRPQLDCDGDGVACE